MMRLPDAGPRAPRKAGDPVQAGLRMKRARVMHYVWLGLAAVFLLNLSTLCVLAFTFQFGPLFEVGGFFQGFIFSQAVSEIRSSTVILCLRIALIVSAVYFWFRWQNWLTCAYLIIAGTAGGFLAVLFFMLPHLAFFGVLLTLCGCFVMALLGRWLRGFEKLPGVNAVKGLARRHRRIGAGMLACLAAAACFEALSWFYVFPLFAKPLPYTVAGWGWMGNKPPYEYQIPIMIDDLKENYRAADLAATCKAAAEYLVWEYGLPSLRMTIINKPHKKQDAYLIATLGTCACDPDKAVPGQWQWSDFTATSAHSEEEAREFDRRLEAEIAGKPRYDHHDTYEKVARGMGYRRIDDLEYPRLKPVIIDLLAKDLFERPSDNWYGKGHMTRKDLPEESRRLYEALVVFGPRQDFPACFRDGGKGDACARWNELKERFDKKLNGNFQEQISPFKTALHDLEKAFSERNETRIQQLKSDMGRILETLQQEMERPPF